MRVARYRPSASLAPFVRSYTVVEAAAETTRLLVPDTGVILGFRYGGFADQLDNGTAVRTPDAAFTGLRPTARRMRTSASGGIVLATFHEGAATAFFADPLHELFGATHHLEDLAPASEVERTTARVVAAGDDLARVAIVEEFLLARRSERRTDPLVSAAVRTIRLARGSIRIGSLSRQLGLSQDRLEKRFRRAVGSSPKQLASILRLRHAIDAYRPGASLASVSLVAGYFDQSHFSREFRAAIGETPQQFFRANGHC